VKRFPLDVLHEKASLSLCVELFLSNYLRVFPLPFPFSPLFSVLWSCLSPMFSSSFLPPFWASITTARAASVLFPHLSFPGSPLLLYFDHAPSPLFFFRPARIHFQLGYGNGSSFCGQPPFRCFPPGPTSRSLFPMPCGASFLPFHRSRFFTFFFFLFFFFVFLFFFPLYACPFSELDVSSATTLIFFFSPPLIMVFSELFITGQSGRDLFRGCSSPSLPHGRFFFLLWFGRVFPLVRRASRFIRAHLPPPSGSSACSLFPNPALFFAFFFPPRLSHQAV